MRLDALGPTNLLKKALFQKRVLVEAHEAHWNFHTLGCVGLPGGASHNIALVRQARRALADLLPAEVLGVAFAQAAQPDGAPILSSKLFWHKPLCSTMQDKIIVA